MLLGKRHVDRFIKALLEVSKWNFGVIGISITHTDPMVRVTPNALISIYQVSTSSTKSVFRNNEGIHCHLWVKGVEFYCVGIDEDSMRIVAHKLNKDFPELK